MARLRCLCRAGNHGAFLNAERGDPGDLRAARGGGRGGPGPAAPGRGGRARAHRADRPGARLPGDGQRPDAGADAAGHRPVQVPDGGRQPRLQGRRRARGAQGERAARAGAALEQETARQALEKEQLLRERETLAARVAASELAAPQGGRVVYLAEVANGAVAQSGQTLVVLARGGRPAAAQRLPDQGRGRRRGRGRGLDRRRARAHRVRGHGHGRIRRAPARRRGAGRGLHLPGGRARAGQGRGTTPR